MDYADFELEVAAAPSGGYLLSVKSPAGEAQGEMKFPYGQLELTNKIQSLQIALLRSGGGTRAPTAEDLAVQGLGRDLFHSLFPEQIANSFQVSRAIASQQDKGLRIKLRISAPELVALPWEYLFDDDLGDYLALATSTPLVRYVPVPVENRPLKVTPPIRILGMTAGPKDLPELNTDREKQRLDLALKSLVDRGVVEFKWVPGERWEDLEEALWQGPWHIFHFVGHGGFNETRQTGVIYLSTDRGLSRELSAIDIGRLLGDHDPLRLAVLNSCETAEGDRTDVFSSTAATLVRRGTPAVVAMQFQITDDAAIQFSRTFYAAIAHGMPIDTAMAAARKAVAVGITNSYEWGTPVLFMRSPDGVLFDLPSAVDPQKAVEQAIAEPIPQAPTLPPPDSPTTPTTPPPATPSPTPAPSPAGETPPAASTVPSLWAVLRDRPRQQLATQAGPFSRRAPSPRVILGTLLLLALLISVGLFVLRLFFVPPEELPSFPPFVGADIFVAPSRGPVGSVVEVNGNGFQANEAVIVHFDSEVVARAFADPNGEFNVAFTVPNSYASSAGSPFEVGATGPESGNVAYAQFIIDPPTFQPTPTAVTTQTPVLATQTPVLATQAPLPATATPVPPFSAYAGWDNLGGDFSDGAAIFAIGNDGLGAMAPWSDGSLRTSEWSAGGWNDWLPLGSTVTTGARPAALAFGDPGGVSYTTDVFVVADNANAQLLHQGCTGSKFEQFLSCGDPEQLGAGFAGGPAAVSWAIGRLDVFARSSKDNTLQHNWFENGSWNAWEAPTPDKIKYGPAAIAFDAALTGAHHIDIFAVGQDNAMYQLTYDDPAGWGTPLSLGGSFSDAPAVTGFGPSLIEVVARSTDGKLQYNEFEGNSWSGWQELTDIEPAAPPAAISWDGNRTDLLVVGQDGAMHHRWVQDGTWHPSE
jgi:hypothetical protein